MDTQKRLHENISALADGELPDCERELAMAELGTVEGQAAWRAYHLAGDVLRNTPQGELSAGFNAALAARLALEPAHTPAAADSDNGVATSRPGQAAAPAAVILP